MPNIDDFHRLASREAIERLRAQRAQELPPAPPPPPPPEPEEQEIRAPQLGQRVRLGDIDWFQAGAQPAPVPPRPIVPEPNWVQLTRELNSWGHANRELAGIGGRYAGYEYYRSMGNDYFFNAAPGINFRDDQEQQEEDEDGMPTKRKQEAFYNFPLSKYLARNLVGKLTDGEIGLEIECEGSALAKDLLKWWTIHQDNSLRVDQDTGEPPLEYVLRKPLSREELSKALDYLLSKLKNSKSKVRDSHRSSVHVHFNCQQKTLKEIVTFICLYLIFENTLVEFSGPNRVGNLFCQRAKDSQYWVHAITEAFRTGQTGEMMSDRLRYTSCNTSALAKFGSLEFRSMRGTVDKDTIDTWIELLCHIKDASEQFEDPYKLYEAYYSVKPLEFFDRIFKGKPKLASVLKSTAGSLEQNMNQGSLFVRDIAYSLETWQPKMKIKESSKKVKEEVIEEPVLDRRVRLHNARLSGQFLVNRSNGIQDKIHPNPNIRPKPTLRGFSVYYDNNGWIATYDDRGEFSAWLTD